MVGLPALRPRRAGNTLAAPSTKTGTACGPGRSIVRGRAHTLPLQQTTTSNMAHRNAERAKEHEREVVHEAEARGLEAERAWNSDGRSLSCTKETDVLLRHPEANVSDCTRVQCKRRKSVASYLTCEDADIVVVREDYQENLAVVPLGHYLDLLRQTAER